MGDKFVVEWGELEIVAPEFLRRDSMSITTGTGGAGTNFPASILFDHAQVELQGYGAPLQGVWAGVIRLPFTLPTNPLAVWFKTDLRLSADVGWGARALVFAAAEGETFVKELTADAAPATPEIAASEGTGASGITHREDSFELVHKALALPASHYSLSLLIVAERRSHESPIRVSFDSVDVLINPNFQSPPQQG